MRLHHSLPLVVLVLSLVFAYHALTTAILETRITTVIISVAHTSKKAIDALKNTKSLRQFREPSRKDDTIAAITRSGSDALRTRQGFGSQTAASLLDSTWHNHLAIKTMTDSGVSKEEVVTPSSWFPIVTTPASATSSSAAHDPQHCFDNDNDCLDMFHQIQQNFTNFNPDQPLEVQDDILQRHFCNQLHEPLLSSQIESCKRCFEQANLDLGTWYPFEAALFNFCLTEKPSAYLLLNAVVDFLNSFRPPSEFSTIIGPDIYNDVSILSTRFTSTPGLMQPKSWSSPSLTNTAQAPAKLTYPTDCLMDDTQSGGACSMVFQAIQRQIDRLPGQRIDPENLDQSDVYQHGLCDLQKHQFSNESALGDCLSCFDRADTRADDLNLFALQIHNFCASKEPSVTFLIINIITFLDAIPAPSGFTIISTDVYNLTSFSTLFTDSTKWNIPASWPPLTTAVPHPRPSSFSTATGTQPTDLLYQLPTSWPFNAPAVARRSGRTATWTLTEPFVTTTPDVPVAIVVASLPWYPRALGAHDILANYTMSIFVNASTSLPPWMTPTMTCSGCGPILTEVPSGAPTVSRASMGQ